MENSILDLNSCKILIETSVSYDRPVKDDTENKILQSSWQFEFFQRNC